MDVTVTFTAWLVLISVADTGALNESSWDPEEELIKHLLDNGYDKRARPGVIVNGTKSQLTVSVVFMPYRIISVDDRLETMTVLLGVQQRWHDPRLVWTPEDFGNLTAVTFDADKIWTPGGRIANLLVINTEDNTDRKRVEVSVSPAQEIYWGSISLSQERCGLDMAYFPFDRQTCSLCLYSAQYRPKDLVYAPLVKQSLYKHGGEWILENIEVSSVNTDISAACLSMTVQRKSLFHVINLFLPTIIICVLNTVGLFASMDADHGEMDYGALGQTTLLSLGVLLLTVAEETPKGAATVSLLGIFFLTMIFQTLLATVMAMYLKKHHRRYEKAHGSSSTIKSKSGSYIRMHSGTICMVLHLAGITCMTAAVFGIGFWNKMGTALSG